MKRLLTLTTFLLLSITSFAYDFKMDDIYYNIRSFTEMPVEVTYKEAYYTEYIGVIAIPLTVTYNGKSYSVTSIGWDAFSCYLGLTSVTIFKSPHVHCCFFL